MNAPVLTSPAADAALAGTDTTLSWEPVDGAAGYRVQVAADPGFETLVVDQRLGAVTSLHVRHLAPGDDGKLYWRVAAKGGPFAEASFQPGTGAPAPRMSSSYAEDRTSMLLMLAAMVLSLVTAVAAFVYRPTDLEATTLPARADSTAAAETGAAAAPAAGNTADSTGN